MKIKARITAADYSRLMLHLTYRRPIMFVVTFFSISFLAMAALYYCGVPVVRKYIPEPLFQSVFCIALTAFIPFSIYRSAIKGYHSNMRLQEEIEYEFSGNMVTMTGESFSSELDLNKSYKIQEYSEWFLIYGSNVIANIVPKNSMTHDEIKELRSFFSRLDGVRVKMLK